MSDNNYILLQNYDKWKELLKYSISTGEKVLITRLDNQVKIAGIYVMHNSDYIMFYKNNKQLFFQIKDQKWNLNNAHCTVHFERKDTNNEFIIKLLDKVVFSHTYKSLLYDPVNMANPDFNKYMEESQDIFLFIYNIMKDKEWQNRIY